MPLASTYKKSSNSSLGYQGVWKPFPKYVPQAVREHITATLQDAPGGMSMLLNSIEKDLEGRREWHEEAKSWGLDQHLLDGIKQDIFGLQRDLIRLGIIEQAIKRIVYDDRMKEVYLLLDELGEQGMKNFVDSAWNACLDYSKYREMLSKSKEINIEISKAASKLCSLLRRADEKGLDLPNEFNNICAVLANTSHIQEGIAKYNFQTCAEGIVKHKDAWCYPNLESMIKTIEKLARGHTPSITGPIGASIIRQRNDKNEYLRGFTWFLTEFHKITLTKKIKTAMAITASVVLEEDVGLDEVKKTQL